MIQVIEIKTFQDRVHHLNQLSEGKCYIVPDIKSKLAFQKFFLKSHSWMPVFCIERAENFYEYLFLSHFPHYQMVSSSHIEFLFQNWANNHDGTIPEKMSILHYLRSFLPILIHPEGELLFTQWLEESSSGQQKTLKSVYDITNRFWKEMNRHQWMESSCALYTLLDQDLKIKNLSSITVDLSFSLSRTEWTLYSLLSRFLDVTILTPSSFDSPVFANAHQIYRLIPEYQSIRQSPAVSSKAKKQKEEIIVQEFPTMVEEVQFITAQIRETLESKRCTPSDIAVVAPQMELYWPCLKSYLQKEGIPFQKEPSISYLSFAQIQKWLSAIRLYFKQISFTRLEDTLHHNANYEETRSNYYHCDREKDVKHLPISFAEKDHLSMDEFLDIIIDLWKPIIKKFPNQELQKELNSLLSEMTLPFFSHLKQPANASQWIQLLEQFLYTKTFHTQIRSAQEGVVCVSLNAITSLNAKQVHFVSLDHLSCQKSYFTLLNDTETKKLLTDLGFDLSHLDPDQHEYELTHFLNTFSGKATLSYHQDQLVSSISYPSRTWLMESQKNPPASKKPSLQTVWESIKRQPSLEKIIQHSATKHCIKDIQQSLTHSHTMNGKEYETITKNLSLSPSKLDQYVQCPFVFLSKNIFKLEDRPKKDMNWSALNKGNLFHQLFEIIMKENLHDAGRIQTLVESYKDELGIMDEELVAFYTSELIQKLNQFLEHEKQKKESFPQLKTLATEIEFQGYWNLKTQQLESKGDVLIKGKIDRVDTHQNQLLIIDYKGSFSAIQTIQGWGKEKVNCQMPIYLQAVESQLTEPPLKEGSVMGAVYLSYYTFEYKGFVDKESGWESLLPARSRSKCDVEKKEKLLQSANQMLQMYIQNIQDGKFSAQPLDKETCKKCYWSQICRAKHLN